MASHVLLERNFNPPIDVDDVRQMAIDGAGCMGIYQVEWQQSLLACDGSNMVCHFKAPDTEAVRNVLRFNGSPYEAVWPCHVYEGEIDTVCNILVERQWPEAVEFKDIAAREKAAAWCLDTYNVTYLRTYFSDDRKRMLCLYQAPDAESVRQAQIQAEMPFESVRAVKLLNAGMLLAK